MYPIGAIRCVNRIAPMARGMITPHEGHMMRFSSDMRDNALRATPTSVDGIAPVAGS